MHRLSAPIALSILLGASCRGSGSSPVSGNADAPIPVVPLDAPAHAGAGNGGGILDTLNFAIIGDTRPANIDDTAHYPSAVVQQIWANVEATQPHPQFAVTTGDYMYASVDGGQQSPQLDAYLGARASFHGIVYPAIGNHECNGFTDSNCGTGSTTGITANYTTYMQRMVQPLGEQQPYFVERFAASDGSWSAKFVFVAANAWSDAQNTWLDAALSEPSTYTFVVRHEPHDAITAPGVVPSQTLINKHPITMQLTGHTHTYEYRDGYKEMVIGNGGAPLTSGANYGYVIAARRADGNITFTSYEYQTSAVVQQIVVTPAGDPAS